MNKKQYLFYLCIVHLIFFGIMWVISKVPVITIFVQKTFIGRGDPYFGAPLGLVIISLPGLIGALPYFWKHTTNSKSAPYKDKIVVASLVTGNTLLCLGYAVVIHYYL